MEFIDLLIAESLSSIGKRTKTPSWFSLLLGPLLQLLPYSRMAIPGHSFGACLVCLHVQTFGFSVLAWNFSLHMLISKVN